MLEIQPQKMHMEVGCPKMHQLLKSHAPWSKSNGNHPTELAKSNKTPMG